MCSLELPVGLKVYGVPGTVVEEDSPTSFPKMATSYKFCPVGVLSIAKVLPSILGT